MNEIADANAHAQEVLEDGGKTPTSQESHLDRLLKGLPAETRAEVLDVIRKEKILDEDDVVIQTARIFSIFSILQKGIATDVKESVETAFKLSEHTIKAADITRIETVAEQLKEVAEEISKKYGKARGATYAIHSIAITFAVLQGTLLGYLLAEEWKVGAILIGTFLLGLFISSFMRKSWHLIRIWFLKSDLKERAVVTTVPGNEQET